MNLSRLPLIGRLLGRGKRTYYVPELCTGCGVCTSQCEEVALVVEHAAVEIDEERCTGCGNCIAACPHDALSVENGLLVLDVDKCHQGTDCDLCHDACPEDSLLFSGRIRITGPCDCDECTVDCHANALVVRSPHPGETALVTARDVVRLAFVALLLWALYTREGTASYLWAIEPFGAFQVLLAAGTVAGSLLIVLVMALAAGAVFCGWICPLGSACNLVPRGSPSLPRLPKFELLVVAAATTLLIGAPAFCAFCPAGALYGGITAMRAPCLAEDLQCSESVLQSYGQAGIDIPCTNDVASCLGEVARLNLLPVAVLTLFAVGLYRYGGNAWCKSLCPLKAAFVILGLRRAVRVGADDDTCTSCGMCSWVCRVDAIDPATVEVNDECTLCCDCVVVCPENAMRLGLFPPGSQREGR